jgi:hypothetical protein
MPDKHLAVSFAEYARTWSECSTLRERLGHYAAGKLRLLTDQMLVVLEIEGTIVACCAATKDAAHDVVICFGRWACKEADA